MSESNAVLEVQFPSIELHSVPSGAAKIPPREKKMYELKHTALRLTWTSEG